MPCFYAESEVEECITSRCIWLINSLAGAFPRQLWIIILVPTVSILALESVQLLDGCHK